MSGRSVEFMDALEPRRLFAARYALAVNFNDEALWDSNFSAAVTQAKALGVQAVRVWFGFNTYDERPNAWDPNPPFGTIPAGDDPKATPQQNWLQQSMKRAFDLKRAGFDVLAVLSPKGGAAPTSTGQVRTFVRYLMDAPETPGSNFKLSDAVDAWEIGNEVDVGEYWAPSKASKSAGLKSYVNNFLIPASQELHTGPSALWERVISAGVSYNPADVQTIISELVAKGATSAVDSIGFHPYNTYTPGSSTNLILDNTKKAVAYAAAIGKTVTATEWNVRGYSVTGSQDATWAKAVDETYRNVILPYYDAGYYFALINNYSARSTGTTSARPAGLLEHTANLDVTPTAPNADLQGWYTKLKGFYDSPMVPAEPFYSTFKSWNNTTTPTTPTVTTGSISGVVWQDDLNKAAPSGWRVFVDLNANGALDGAEPSGLTTGTTGAYTINFDSSLTGTGTGNLKLALPTGYVTSTNVGVTLLSNTKQTGKNFGVRKVVGTGSIAGVTFRDNNANGVFDSADTRLGSRVAFIDSNSNGKFDTGEPAATSDSSGNYKITGLLAGTYKVARSLASGYKLSNSPAGYVSVTLSSNTQAVTGIHLGSVTSSTVVKTSSTTPTTPTTPSPSTPTTGSASISGKVFAQISTWNAAVSAIAWKVFLDTDNDGVRDTGETYATAAADGTYALTGLAAGNYTVAMEKVSGWNVVTPSTKTFAVTLTTTSAKTGKNFVVAKA